MPESVYLAGPISDRDDNGRGWRDGVKTAKTDCEWIDPLEKYNHEDRSVDEEWSSERIVREDLALIDRADGVLAYYNGERTFGTPMELYYAHQAGKPVAVVWDCDRAVSPWAEAHSIAVRNTVEWALTDLLTASEKS